jgi:tetratricopeptide (TPR) repeat protein
VSLARLGFTRIQFFCFFAVLMAFSGCASQAQAQGFAGGITSGKTKKKVVLARKLPSAVRLMANSFAVKTTAHDKNQADVAQSLSDVLETEIMKNDHKLREEKNSPDFVVSCTITHFEIPPPQSFVRNEVVVQKGHNLEEPKKFYKITGSLDVAYQARDRAGKILDSDNFNAKYSREFEEGTNQATDKSITSKMVDPFKRAAGKKTDDSGAPPTPIELRHQLIQQIVTDIATRLVSTEQAVDVYLARGKLDGANKLAESGLWSRYLENLETMTPFSNPHDDAYRLYNIGVAYEALGYQTADHAAAKKFLEQASIYYGKAIDGKPDEKFFLEPQNRIETAVAYYKKLEERRSDNVVAAAEPADSKATVKTAKGTHADPSAPAALAAKKPSAAKAPLTNAAATQKDKPAAAALTNDKVVEMVKSGVDEDNVIVTIRQAAAVNFDISPDGQIQLAKNGVKGKIVAAMRERSRQSKSSAAN